MMMAVGATYCAGNFWRYYIVFPDPSEVVTGCAIGALVFAVGWLYNAELQHSNSISAIEDYLDDKQLSDKKIEEETLEVK